MELRLSKIAHVKCINYLSANFYKVASNIQNKISYIADQTLYAKMTANFCYGMHMINQSGNSSVSDITEHLKQQTTISLWRTIPVLHENNQLCTL